MSNSQPSDSLPESVQPEVAPASYGTQSGNVSEVALFVAKLIPVLPDETVADLARLLRRRLTVFDQHRVRYTRLGLLIDLVSEGTGEVPSTRRYEAERARRAAAGEKDWPTHSTLDAAYGSWLLAVQAAMLLWRDGSAARVPNSTHHQHESGGAYSYDEAADALVTCYEQVGQWPHEWEYADWRRISRDLARKSGVEAPRYPERDTWFRMFGEWDAFDAAAKRRWADTHPDASASSIPPHDVEDADPEASDDGAETRLAA